MKCSVGGRCWELCFFGPCFRSGESIVVVNAAIGGLDFAGKQVGLFLNEG